MRAAVENYLTSLRRGIGARLEAGRGMPWPLPAPSVVRRVALPAHAHVIGVGGALLGGSGRTPLALAIASYLAARNVAVAFVGHGYGARHSSPLRVRAQHTARDVGDEAVLAARRLPCPVWVGPREATLHAAARAASVLVVDGLLQTSPQRLALSVLALSAPNPWGSGKVLPRGDLRSTKPRLVAAADQVIVLSSERDCRVHDAPNASVAHTVLHVPATGRYGLFLCIARPERVERELSRLGHCVPVTLRGHDHGSAAWEARARALMTAHELEGFLVTDKCDAGLGSSSLPRAIVRLELTLPASLTACLDTFPTFTHVS